MYPNSADFHPLKYVEGLIDAFVRRGGRYYEDSAVVDQTEYSGKEVWHQAQNIWNCVPRTFCNWIY